MYKNNLVVEKLNSIVYASLKYNQYSQELARSIRDIYGVRIKEFEFIKIITSAIKQALDKNSLYDYIDVHIPLGKEVGVSNILVNININKHDSDYTVVLSVKNIPQVSIAHIMFSIPYHYN